MIPGKVNIQKFEFVIPLEANTAKLWRTVITKAYHDNMFTEPIGNVENKERRNSVLERRKRIASDVQQRNSGLGQTGIYVERLKLISEAYSSGSLDEIRRNDDNFDLQEIQV